MKANFFIIPGFKMQAKDKSFSWLHTFLKSKGFNVIDVPVQWNYKTLSANSQEFVNFYRKNKGTRNYVLGFSYGAVIAFITAGQLQPNKLLLCSLSATFKEDCNWNKNWIGYIGKKRFADSLTISADELARNIKTNTTIFCGEKEAKKYPALFKRCKEVADMSNSELVVVEKSPHQIDFSTYQEAIKNRI